MSAASPGLFATALKPPSPARRERDSFRAAEAGRGSGFGQRSGNCTENTSQVIQHVNVTKSQHGVPQLPQLRIPQRVVNSRFGRVVNTTVEFHDDSSARAAEIDDVAPNRFLPLELPAFDRVSSQLEPQALLGGRRSLPIVSSQFRQVRLWHIFIVRRSLSRCTGEGQLPRSGSRERVGS